MKLTAERFLTHYLALHSTGGRALLAVSGGMDSMVLTHLMHSVKLPFAIAHINYRLREADSEKDAELVKEYASNYAVDYFPYFVSDEEHDAMKSSSTQEMARKIRYRWFREVAAENGFNFIVTAHHADDQAETMLFHFIRGSGPVGLAGMNNRTREVIRPLLSFTRNDILEYAAAHGVRWREDRSNFELKYTRNRLRNEMIPLIEEINPAFGLRMSALSPVYLETAALIQQSMKAHWKEQVKCTGRANGISASWLADFSFPLLMMSEWLIPAGFTFAQCADALQLIGAESGKHIASHSHELWKDRDILWLLPFRSSSSQTEILQAEDTECVQFPVQSSMMEIDQWQLDPSPFVAQLDEDKLIFPLTIRQWQEGDRIQPIGLDGTQKVSDILVQAKVPQFLKSEVCVVESNGQIVWVVGHRLADGFKVTTHTQRVRVMSWDATFEKPLP